MPNWLSSFCCKGTSCGSHQKFTVPTKIQYLISTAIRPEGKQRPVYFESPISFLMTIFFHKKPSHHQVWLTLICPEKKQTNLGPHVNGHKFLPSHAVPWLFHITLSVTIPCAIPYHWRHSRCPGLDDEDSNNHSLGRFFIVHDNVKLTDDDDDNDDNGTIFLPDANNVWACFTEYFALQIQTMMASWDSSAFSITGL